MLDGGDGTPTSGPGFDYTTFGLWYDAYLVEVLDPALREAEAALSGLLRDALSDRDLARIRRPVGRVKSKPRVWRKMHGSRYVDRIGKVEDIPGIIDDLVGVRLTCTNRRDIDVVREVLDVLPTVDEGGPVSGSIRGVSGIISTSLVRRDIGVGTPISDSPSMWVGCADLSPVNSRCGPFCRTAGAN